MTTLLWFRQDLRLRDNSALNAALARGGPVVPLFILDDEGEGRWRAGGASRWWLHHSLAALDASLRDRGSRLILAQGNSEQILQERARAVGADAIYWNHRYEPEIMARDQALATRLAADFQIKRFNSALLFEPQTIANQQGRPFQVFTPYWRHCLARPVAVPEKLPAGSFRPPKRWPSSLDLETLALRPKKNWDAGFFPEWQPGETGGQARLKQFLKRSVDTYQENRNLPAEAGTSRLSPWLHFGEIGPRQIWAAARARHKTTGVFPSSQGMGIFLTEIGWREFAHHLLFHFPHTPERPLRAAFEDFPWAADPRGAKLRAWQRGRTGYPIVDAGMRQLWHTGWMHNRVRMLVASFLVKHLRLSWTDGARWFWDTLVDADLANNTLGWQWSAGCGADAAPYFRIFAPVLQGEKFDGQGEYVRRWIPELAKLSEDYLHRPWEAPPELLAAAGVTLGETYPRPIVDHAEARAEALAALKSVRQPRSDRKS